jgi:hypothetical protein
MADEIADEVTDDVDDDLEDIDFYAEPPPAWRRALPFVPYVLAALALVFGWYWGYQNLKWSRELSHRLEALRVSGQPMQASELALTLPPNDQNAALIYEQVFHVSFTRDAQNDMTLVSGLTKDEAMAVTTFVASGDPEQADTVARVLSRPAVQDALRIMDEGSRRPDCVFPVIWQDGPNAAMPHLEKFRAASLLIAAQIRSLYRHGQRAEALHWLAVGLRMARHAGTDPDRLAGLAEYNMCTTVLRPAREAVCNGPPPGPHEELDAALRALPFNKQAQHDLPGDLTLALQTFHDLGQDPVTTRALLGPDYSNGVDAGRWARYLGPLSAPWRAYDECVFLDFMTKLIKTQVGPTPQTRWQVDDLMAETAHSATAWRAPVTNILVSIYDEYLSKRDLAQTEVSLCEVSLAIRDYQAQHGQLPDKLKELPAPPSGPSLTDLYSGKPLVYRRPRTGGFILYSFGPGREDEEGQSNEDEQGRRLNTGNIVWGSSQE